MATITDDLALSPPEAARARAIRARRGLLPVEPETAKAVLKVHHADDYEPETRWMTTPERDVWVNTVSGAKVSLLSPDPDAITIEDIAHSLSMICRFNGHLERFYSVAEHCVFVSRLVEPELAMIGLLHDASEAYLGDVISPVKKLMFEHRSPAFKDAELRVWGAICERFGLDPALLPKVKQADLIARATEKRDLLKHDLDVGCEGVEPADERLAPYRGKDHEWSPQRARATFLDRFHTIRARAI